MKQSLLATAGATSVVPTLGVRVAVLVVTPAVVVPAGVLVVLSGPVSVSRRAVEAMTIEEKTAVMKIAAQYAMKTPYRDRGGLDGGRALFHEAIVRILEGDRSWPRGLAAIQFFAGVAKSIAYEWRDRRTELEEADWNLTFNAEAPERGAIAKIDLARIIGLFENNSIERNMVLGIAAGAKGEELRKQARLSKTQYDSMRTDIRRKVEKFQLQSGYNEKSRE